MIESRLEIVGPLAVSIVFFPSYNNQDLNGVALAPTPAYMAAYIANRIVYQVHTMLLAGHGVDENGNAFWEVQDDSENINNGDCGYLRFSQELLILGSLIVEYIEIVLRG
ncbi:unnamed protein product [Arabis nemorensis]|uniref:Uncharacterized protein n=1 Tax=Arabis nemorensis TaxID=586526 RepID=A0A565B2Y2_9BRAS|nr:unnamed protein product [Arabis nemorensis]